VDRNRSLAFSFECLNIYVYYYNFHACTSAANAACTSATVRAVVRASPICSKVPSYAYTLPWPPLAFAYTHKLHGARALWARRWLDFDTCS